MYVGAQVGTWSYFIHEDRRFLAGHGHYRRSWSLPRLWVSFPKHCITWPGLIACP
jgi:hypothetical protein